MIAHLPIDAATAVGTLRCPPGHKLRVLAVSVDVTADEGECVVLGYARGGITIVRATSPQFVAGVTAQLDAAIGLGVVAPHAVNIDPVTGAVSYSSLMLGLSMPLPDMWWEADVQITSNLVLTSGTLTYEVVAL